MPDNDWYPPAPMAPYDPPPPSWAFRPRLPVIGPPPDDDTEYDPPPPPLLAHNDDQTADDDTSPQVDGTIRPVTSPQRVHIERDHLR